MATTVAPSQFTMQLTGTLLTALSGIPTPTTIVETLSLFFSLQNGVGSGKIDLAPMVVSGSLSASASTTYDLTSYTDVAGNTVTTMTKAKVVWIKNTGTVALDIGGAAATQFIGSGFLKAADDVFTLASGQVLPIFVTAGITVSGTIKSLKVLNTSGSVAATYDLVIAGSST